MAKEKIKMNYKKITLEEMVLFIRDNDKEEGTKFIKGFYEKEPAKTKLVNVLDAEGKPETYINKKGKTAIRKKRVAVGAETKEVYNVLKAKRAFYDRYKDKIEFENAPKEKAEEKKDDKIKSALSLLD